MKSVRHAPRGFLVMGTVIGLVIALALVLMFTATVMHQAKAERQLEKTRAAVRQAETALLQLQGGQPVTVEGVTIEPLADVPAPAEKIWVRVTASARPLVGLVPANAVPRPTTGARPAPEGGVR